MFRYLEQKDHEKAYQVACLGVTEHDWRALAIDCIQAKKYKIAKRAFIRNKDVRFLDLLQKIEVDRKDPRYNDFVMMGEIVAYQGKY
jgi:intraflagellar transport protein 122